MRMCACLQHAVSGIVLYFLLYAEKKWIMSSWRLVFFPWISARHSASDAEGIEMVRLGISLWIKCFRSEITTVFYPCLDYLSPNHRRRQFFFSVSAFLQRQNNLHPHYGSTTATDCGTLNAAQSFLCYGPKLSPITISPSISLRSAMHMQCMQPLLQVYDELCATVNAR